MLASRARAALSAPCVAHRDARPKGCRAASGVPAQQVVLGAAVLVDAMGSFSPIARQARRGAKPDSVVLMVGSCARGLPPAAAADLLYAFTPLCRRALS